MQDNQSSDNNSTTNYPGVAEGSPFRYSDLQIAKVTLTTTEGVTTGSSAMAHRMGLAEIELKTATYYAIAESNGGTSTITRSKDTNEEVTASSSFDDSGFYHVPMQKGNTNFYYAVVPTGEASTEFNSTAGADQWRDAYTATGLTSGGVDHYDAYSTRVGTSTYSGSFSFSGSYLTFNVPFTGTYTIECWGAQGCTAFTGMTSTVTQGGYGAYCYGKINCEKTDELYIYIGQQGASTKNTTAWNDGGASYNGSHAGDQTRGGGGSTDIRLTSGTWNTSSSLRSRIMVAGAGGGATDYNNGYAGCVTLFTKLMEQRK